MRGHAKGKEVANELIGLLSSTEEEGHKKYATASHQPDIATACVFLTSARRSRLSVLAAQSMDVIIGDSEDVLNVHTSSRIRVPASPRHLMHAALARGFRHLTLWSSMRAGAVQAALLQRIAAHAAARFPRGLRAIQARAPARHLLPPQAHPQVRAPFRAAHGTTTRPNFSLATGASHGCFEAPTADPFIRLRLSGR